MTSRTTELDYYQQALRGSEKVLGKTHPDTLNTVTNMAVTYKKTGDFAKAEEGFRRALDGHEKSLEKGNQSTRKFARGLALLLETIGTRKQDLRKVLGAYPHLMQAESWDL